MRAFSRKLLKPNEVMFLAAVLTRSPQGGTRSDLPNTGPTLDASVQVGRVERTQPDGMVLVDVVYHVYTDDTSSLNSGAGVRVDDAFLWQGKILQCQSASVNVGGVNALWLTECMEVR